MILSGRNIRRIYTDAKSLAFDVSMEISNLTGEANFGVSGAVVGGPGDGNPESTLFNFKSGRVFDPNGKNVYSYQRNTPINLKGTFLNTSTTSTYDYFIDDNLISSVGTRTPYLIDKIFLESKNCEIELNDLNFYGPTGTIDLATPMNFDVNISDGNVGIAGNIGHGNVGDDSNVYQGTSKAGNYLTFEDAITFNHNLPIDGDVISGEVTLGSEFFLFDNREAYLKNNLSGITAGSVKDLSLMAVTDLSDGFYPVEINFYTTFGNVTRNALIIGGSPVNPSGVKVDIGGDGYPLQSGQNTTHPLSGPQGDPVSGSFHVNYSVDLPLGEDATLGLPYKIYLEHVEGDHSKNYSFITGVELSGSGIGYSVDEDLKRKVTFRYGNIGSDNPLTTDGATFGSETEERATGLINTSALYNSMITEANIDSIRTNLYNGDGSVGVGQSNIKKMQDGTLMTQHENVHDIVTVFDVGPNDTVTEKPSGIAKVMSYQKPASDWQMFTGAYGESTDSYIEHTQTGISETPLRRHNGDEDVFLGVVLKAKNYVDTDPMVYNLVFSGADGYGKKHPITGTVMETGYDVRVTPKGHAGA